MPLLHISKRYITGAHLINTCYVLGPHTACHCYLLAWCREYSAVMATELWNFLPVQLRNPDITYGLFQRQLKGRLFREA